MSSAQPSISDFAFISDCHSSALISRAASIDWCCMPTFDAGSCFGRLLDYENGGHCSITAKFESISRTYIDGTQVLKTTFHTKSGAFDVFDFFVVCEGGLLHPKHQLVRIIECTTSQVEGRIKIQPRFDYGLLPPWIRQEDKNCFSAIGGNDALVINSDVPLSFDGVGSVNSNFELHAGQRIHLSLRYFNPAQLEYESFPKFDGEDLDRSLTETIDWWHKWSAQITYDDPDKQSIVRSALVLKGLCYAPTGAIIAAPTTSLPESLGGHRNWDYRYSWIRDSVFSSRALSEIGCTKEAVRFRNFVQRSAASNADSLLIMYGVDGRRRLDEVEITQLTGYKNSKPVRIGNEAFKQKQFDCYGLLLQLIWSWHLRGKSPDDELWKFISRLVELVCKMWQEPDQGLWESRGAAKHFVHSKVMLWFAVECGINLANDCMRKAPLRKWQSVRKQIRAEIESKGVHPKSNFFVQSFGAKSVDAALLLLPHTGFVDWKDPRMVATCDEIMARLDYKGLLHRYEPKTTHDGLTGEEGTFIACTFWLVECLAKQGRVKLAREYFDRALACRNDLGLFSEEFDPVRHEMLGNFPQGLSHLSHIAAAVSLKQASVF